MNFVDDVVNSDVVVLEVEASTAMIALRCEAKGFLNNRQVRVAIMDECRLLQDLLDCEVQEPTVAFDGYMRGEKCILMVAEQVFSIRCCVLTFEHARSASRLAIGESMMDCL